MTAWLFTCALSPNYRLSYRYITLSSRLTVKIGSNIRLIREMASAKIVLHFQDQGHLSWWVFLHLTGTKKMPFHMQSSYDCSRYAHHVARLNQAEENNGDENKKGVQKQWRRKNCILCKENHMMLRFVTTMPLVLVGDWSREMPMEQVVKVVPLEFFPRNDHHSLCSLSFCRKVRSQRREKLGGKEGLSYPHQNNNSTISKGWRRASFHSGSLSHVTASAVTAT